MPAYHSTIDCNVRFVKSIPLLPLKTSVRGPAPSCNFYKSKNVGDGPDILDETLTLFRANSFFRNFEIKSPADILLIYSTLFIQECLVLLSSKPPSPIGDSSKLLLTHAARSFPIPGEPGFPLNAIVDPVSSKEDQGT